MKLFEVTPVFVDGATRWPINPFHVVLARQQWTAEESHVEGCERDVRCSLVNKEEGDSACSMVKGTEFTELLFVNTIGQQSSLAVQENLKKVRELWNDALKGGF